MSSANRWRLEVLTKHVVPDANDFGDAADELCEKALSIAKNRLHPLLRNLGLERLEGRTEFLEEFKGALENGISGKLAVWQPGVQAVFKYEESRLASIASWDGTIHLLVKVSRLSKRLHALGKTLDGNLLKSLQRLGWQRVGMRQSILELQQVTPRELRYGIGYGALFHAVYTAPVRVWPPEGRGK